MKFYKKGSISDPFLFWLQHPKIVLELSINAFKLNIHNLFRPFCNKNDWDFNEDFSFVHQPNKPN